MNINIKTFDKWAKLNKDESMEKGHQNSVDKMFEIIEQSKIINNSFSFIDIGCGNGWVIRKILEKPNCNDGLGIDGSKQMIKKANDKQKGRFIQTEIESFSFSKKFDIVFSMETFYYFKDPKSVIQNIYNNGLKNNGMIVIGIDHFKENTESLSWGEDYNLELTTLSTNEWIELFTKSNFKQINHFVNEYKNNDKTLIISAEK